jgi:hypothetical protein
MTKPTNTKSTGGRPPRHADERLSKNRTFRVRDQLDQQLQDAADASGRSVSEEIELRLAKSFTADALSNFSKDFSRLQTEISSIAGELLEKAMARIDHLERALERAVAGSPAHLRHQGRGAFAHRKGRRQQKAVRRREAV